MANSLETEDKLDKLMLHLGEFGTYQMQQFLLHILAAMTAGLHMLSVVTTAAVPDHRCAVPHLEQNNTYLPFNSPEVMDNWIPKLSNGAHDSCHVIDSETNLTTTCNQWVYDTTYYKTSRGMEWNFVCDNRWMGAVTQSIYMFGVFTGAVTLGSMADKYGRKIIFYVSAVLQLIFGLLVAFIPHYYIYLSAMYIYGMFGSAGAYITGFVMTMELVGASKRTACGMTFQGMFALGVMLVAVWGFFISDRVYLQVVYGLHSLVLIGHWWLIDESPRWLWSQGRYNEAVDIIEKAIKVNGFSIELDKTTYLSTTKFINVPQDEKSYSVIDMVRTPKLRLKSLNAGLNWFANSLVYYGLSLNAGKLFGNPFLVLFILGLVEIPSYIVSTALLDRVGRRFLTAIFLLLGGFACLAAAIIPRVSVTGSVIATSVVFIGKFCIASSFAIIYNYSAEMFPTVIRNTAVGVGSMCARLSATLTPLISLLDSFDPRVPTAIFALVAILSGALTTLLPETLNQPMPQSLEDGETFGDGDTCCTTGCFGNKKRAASVPLHEMD